MAGPLGRTQLISARGSSGGRGQLGGKVKDVNRTLTFPNWLGRQSWEYGLASTRPQEPESVWRGKDFFQFYVSNFLISQGKHLAPQRNRQERNSWCQSREGGKSEHLRSDPCWSSAQES